MRMEPFTRPYGNKDERHFGWILDLNEGYLMYEGRSLSLNPFTRSSSAKKSCYSRCHFLHAISK